jgi:hypothetical protein
MEGFVDGSTKISCKSQAMVEANRVLAFAYGSEMMVVGASVQASMTDRSCALEAEHASGAENGAERAEKLECGRGAVREKADGRAGWMGAGGGSPFPPGVRGIILSITLEIF